MSTAEIDVEDEVVGSTVEDVSPFLGMSDEEIMKAPAPDFAALAAAAAVEKPAALAPVEKETKKEAAVEEVVVPEGGDKPTELAAADATVEVKEVKTKVPGDPKEAKTEEVKEPKAEGGAEDDKPKAEVVVNFEAEYKRLLTPFKANGREIAVESVDDAIALMQMGANYNKKMAALKPNLKLMKMLENNGFMSEDKISFLIDLGKKDPAAINKLVKDSGIDPMDLDAEKAGAYKQSTYAVDDREMELDTVLDELQGTATYTRTLDVVSNKWDVASKQTVSQSPQLLKVINDHVASGIYDLISKEVDRERVFGRLKGLSDIEAYRQVGDSIQARGGFNHVGKAPVEKPAAPVIVVPKPKVEDDKLKDKRRAASATQPAASTGVKADFNPLDLSDEDFGKLGNPKFL